VEEQRFPTPNYTAGRTEAPRWIVLHSTRGGSRDDFAATVNWFANPKAQVSSHLLVAQDGRVARFVADEDTAWHCGFCNPYTLGIEIEQPTADTPFTEAELAVAAECVKRWRVKFGPIEVLGHEDTPQGIQAHKSDPGEMFPWVRFMEMVNMDAAKEIELAVRRSQIEAIAALAAGNWQKVKDLAVFWGAK
jgi:N-acetylmuramoyl-L-alanine amidase